MSQPCLLMNTRQSSKKPLVLIILGQAVFLMGADY